uniref:uncharacterized protein LOC124064238 isoform X2 n=1 Tax=Scatophagus argus TaxID=75038 RepID=UPI001ED860BF|nr:uncharacterized protein LOC124064238 isoform X2 [Scatophagus argus]
MKSCDEDRCPVARPPRSCLRSGPTRGTRVTFSWDSRLCEEEEEEDPGEGQTVSTPLFQPLLTLTTGQRSPRPPPRHQAMRSVIVLTANRLQRSLDDFTGDFSQLLFPDSSAGGSVVPGIHLCLPLSADLNDAAQHSQEVGVSADRPQGHTWSDTWSLQSGGSVGVSELSVVLGGLLQLVEQHWNGPGSLRRHQQFLSGSYDLLSELLQPAGGRGPPAKGTSQSCELVLLRRKLERTELQLERMKSRLLLALKENYQLRRSLQLTSEQQTHRDDVT